MKNFKITLAIFLMLLANSCAEDADIKKENVQFVINLSDLANDEGGRVLAGSEIPLGSSLRISIETASGESILSLEDIELLRVGDNVLTPPIELIPGSYMLTDFMIVSVDNEVLYATPRRGSALEKFVAQPLDVSFVVSSGGLKKLNMEVVDVTAATPEDFGYLSFNVNVVHPLQVAVFAATSDGLQLTSAKLTIEQGEPILQTINLAAKVNKIGFRHDPEQLYTIRITKPGYQAYVRETTYSDLVGEIQAGTLNVVMEPGMAIVTKYYKVNTDLIFYMSGSSLLVDWGDGTVEAINGELNHNFASGRRYTVNISGNLSQVRELGGFYNDANFEELDLTPLTQLEVFSLGLALTPKVLDFSQNKKLVVLFLFECRGTERIIAPETEFLEEVVVSGSQLSPQGISALIDRIHSNAVIYSKSGGIFRLLLTTFPENEDQEGLLAGPPSMAALDKLKSLRDDYHWTVEPDEF